MKTPEEVRAEHDKHMAQPMVEYRGYFLKPLSHVSSPHFVSGTYVYWGWVVIDRSGCNAAPGATWGLTVEQAKKIVDCMYDAGYRADMTFDEALAWQGGEKFWLCMQDCDDECMQDSEDE